MLAASLMSGPKVETFPSWSIITESTSSSSSSSSWSKIANSTHKWGQWIMTNVFTLIQFYSNCDVMDRLTDRIFLMML